MVNIKPPPTWWAGAPPIDLEQSTFSPRTSVNYTNTPFLTSTIDPFNITSGGDSKESGIDGDILRGHPIFSMPRIDAYDENLEYG